jgi:hypothetical protein
MKQQILGASLLGASALAVSPLTVDDADTVAPRHLQLNLTGQYEGARNSARGSLQLNPVLGLTARGEVGVSWGHLWLRDDLAPGGSSWSDGISDLALATKWRLWPAGEQPLRFALRVDCQVPAASASRGLGTGEVDLGGTLLATWTTGRTSLDFNLGFTALAPFKSTPDDDQWFLGLAVRHELNERWTLLGEAFVLLPHGRTADPARVFCHAGAQMLVGKTLVSCLLGAAVGDGDPSFSATIGCTWDF